MKALHYLQGNSIPVKNCDSLGTNFDPGINRGQIWCFLWKRVRCM